MSVADGFRESRIFGWPGQSPQRAADLMGLAQTKTGLSDFGEQPVEDALDRLMYACREEAGLNLIGRLSTGWDNLRLLKNLLILRDRERADPAILARPVERPIFVIGLPRSGTTYLHALLAEDADSQAVRCWQAVYPYPDHPAADRNAGPRTVQRQFDAFHLLAPELRRLHPFAAETPQECTELTAHSFASMRFDTSYDVPSYRHWLDCTGHLNAYRVHRRFLQHLQGERPRRWVLKAPDHVFALHALRAVYPDARLVISHRDPLKVLPSVARLTEVLRRPFARRVDKAAIGTQVARDWTLGGTRLVEADASGLWPTDQVAHVHFKALTADPVGTVRNLYARFGMTVSLSYATRLKAVVSDRPNGGYGRNVYRFEDFGLRAGDLRERFAPLHGPFRRGARGRHALKRRTGLLAAAGIGLLAWLVLSTGIGPILQTVGSVGWLGFALVLLSQLALTSVAATAWAVLGARTTGLSWPAFAWARFVREAVGQALPFTPIGGIAVGGRALALEDAPAPAAIAATLTDTALEFASQIAYAALGAALLQRLRPGQPVSAPLVIVLGALALMAALLLAALLSGGRGIERRVLKLVRRDGEGALPVSEALVALRRRPGAAVRAGLVHFAGWTLTAGQTWLILRLLGAPVGLGAAVVIDSLTSAARAAVFVAPAGLGVQEGALVLLGHLFGVGAPAALALSLLRRGRDLTLAVPVLATWQLRHGGRIWRIGAGGSTST